MTATVGQAKDDIFERFRTEWEGDAASTSIPVKWPDVAQGEFPPKTQDADGEPVPWARITILHNLGAGGEAAISGDGGVGARRRYTRFGVVTVELFTPWGDGGVLADQLNMVVLRAFESQRTPNGVIFRNVRPVEQSRDGAYRKDNVLCEFEYDEVR